MSEDADVTPVGGIPGSGERRRALRAERELQAQDGPPDADEQAPHDEPPPAAEPTVVTQLPDADRQAPHDEPAPPPVAPPGALPRRRPGAVPAVDAPQPASEWSAFTPVIAPEPLRFDEAGPAPWEMARAQPPAPARPSADADSDPDPDPDLRPEPEPRPKPEPHPDPDPDPEPEPVARADAASEDSPTVRAVPRPEDERPRPRLLLVGRRDEPDDAAGATPEEDDDDQERGDGERPVVRAGARPLVVAPPPSAEPEPEPARSGTAPASEEAPRPDDDEPVRGMLGPVLRRGTERTKPTSTTPVIRAPVLPPTPPQQAPAPPVPAATWEETLARNVLPDDGRRRRGGRAAKPRHESGGAAPEYRPKASPDRSLTLLVTAMLLVLVALVAVAVWVFWPEVLGRASGPAASGVPAVAAQHAVRGP